jgi:hypothetical protein
MCRRKKENSHVAVTQMYFSFFSFVPINPIAARNRREVMATSGLPPRHDQRHLDGRGQRIT